MSLILSNCGICDGTGKRIDTFDFPKKSNFINGDTERIIDKTERNHIGYPFIDGKCHYCDGTGILICGNEMI